MIEKDKIHFTEDEPLSFNTSEPSSFSDNIPPSTKDDAPWKVLIVDDDEEIHAITKVVLRDFTFENRPLSLISCYSAEDAFETLKNEHDVALILLDVVMETDDAGLKCVKEIRETLNNKQVRIILRTGQPGQAPEKEVIVKYDINDYKEKTELTSLKLFTVVTTSLRSYQYIKTIDQNRKGLENIITASHGLFNNQSLVLFATGILRQITSILQLDDSSLYLNCSSLSVFQDEEDHEFYILAATGDFAGKENCPIKTAIPDSLCKRIIDTIEKKESVFTSNTFIGYFETNKGERSVLYLQWHRDLTSVDKDLISIFSTNVAIAFENISLNKEVISTQKEVIFTLSEIVEGRSKETANHLRRVADISSMLARKLGLSEKEVEIIRLASPMHDIGKVATPDHILTKPGKLTPEEFEVIKEHSALGYTIFKNSSSEMMMAAAIIAHQHHERWDGTGYPQGLEKENIHIFGRIAALADVVDALLNKRCYKEPWSMEDVIETVKQERGKHFDPKVVDAFLDSIEECQEILSRWP